MSTLKSPQFYGQTFKMPPRVDTYPLEILNAHPNDDKVSFDESRHAYSYEGTPIKTSVTGLVDSFFEKFVPEVAVEKMMNGPKWPRAEYIHKDGTVFTPAQIMRKWENSGLYARNRGNTFLDLSFIYPMVVLGTWMHFNIERYFNQLEIANDIPEMSQFLAFNEDEINSKGIKPFRTEWRIVAPDLNLAGSVDFVGQMPDGTYCIMDWKRAKNLAGQLTNGYNKKATYASFFLCISI